MIAGQLFIFVAENSTVYRLHPRFLLHGKSSRFSAPHSHARPAQRHGLSGNDRYITVNGLN